MSNLIEEARMKKLRASQEQEERNSIRDQNTVFFHDASIAFHRTELFDVIKGLWNTFHNTHNRIGLMQILHAENMTARQDYIVNPDNIQLPFHSDKVVIMCLSWTFFWGLDLLARGRREDQEEYDAYSYITNKIAIAYFRDRRFQLSSADRQFTFEENQWKYDQSSLGRALGYCVEHPIQEHVFMRGYKRSSFSSYGGA